MRPARIMKNSVAFMGGRTYHAILSLLAIRLIAQYLELEGFGEYGFIMAVCTIFMVITDMGTSTICIREMARDLSKANAIFWAGTVVKFVLSFVTFGCIALVINAMSDSSEIISATYIAAAAVILLFLGDIFHAVFVAFEKMGYSALLSSVQMTCYLFFLVLFIQLDFGMHGIFGALLLSYGIRILTGIVILFRKFFKPSPYLNVSLCLYLLKEAYFIGISRILRKTSFRIDTVLLKIMRSASEVGLFYGVYRIILVLTLIPQSINQALFPTISRLAVESKDSLGRLLEKSVKILLLLVIPLVCVVVFLSEEAIEIVLGKSFSSAAPAMMVLSLVWGVMFFSDLFVRALNGCDRQSLATKAVASCLIVNVVADIVLIHLFGYLGAVFATLLGEITLFVGAYYFISKNVAKICWRKVVFKPLLAGILMAAVMYVLNSTSRAAALLAGPGMFFIAIIVLQVFDREEMEIIRERLQKIRHRFGYLTAR